MLHARFFNDRHDTLYHLPPDAALSQFASNTRAHIALNLAFLVFGARAVRAGAKRESYECVAGRYLFQFPASTKVRLETSPNFRTFASIFVVFAFMKNLFVVICGPCHLICLHFYGTMPTALMELKG